MYLTSERLMDILLTLKKESMSSNSDTILDTMKKYDMLFLGKNFNIIYSNELTDFLNTSLGFNMTLDEVNKLLIKSCSMLNMDIKLVSSNKSSTVKSHSKNIYQISLWN